MKSLMDMSAKELKVYAAKFNIEVKKNDTAKAALLKIAKALPEVALMLNPLKPIANKLAEKPVVEAKKESTSKVYLGNCVKTGKKLYK